MLKYLKQWLGMKPETRSVYLSSMSPEEANALGLVQSEMPTLAKALSIASYYRGIDLIASYVGRTQLDLLERTDKSKEFKKGDWRNKAIERPNPFTSRYAFIKTLTANAIAYGNGIGYIYGRELWNVRSDAVEIKTDNNTGEVLYIYTDPNSGRQQVWLQHEVIHIKGLSFDGVCGVPLLQAMAESLKVAYDSKKYQSESIGEGRIPSYWINSPHKDKETVAYYTNELTKKYANKPGFAKPLVLLGGAQAGPLAITAQDMAIIEQQKLTILDMCNFLGIPPHKVGLPISTSYSSLEQENMAFLNECLAKWFEEVESEFNLKLRTESEIDSDSCFFEFNLHELKKADKATEVNLLIAELNNGLVSRENAQAILNLPTDGQFRMPANIIIEPEGEQTEDVDLAPMQQLLSAATKGEVPIESVKPMLLAAYPGLEPSVIDAIVSPLAAQKAEQEAKAEAQIASQTLAPESKQPEKPQEAPEEDTRGLLLHTLDRLKERVSRSSKAPGYHFDIVKETLASAYGKELAHKRASYLLENLHLTSQEIIDTWK